MNIFNNFLKTYLIVGIISFVLMLLYDISLYELQSVIISQFRKTKRKLLYYPKFLIISIYIEDNILSFLHFIRLKWVGRYADNEDKIYKLLNYGINKVVIKITAVTIALLKYAFFILFISSLIYFKSELISINYILGINNLCHFLITFIDTHSTEIDHILTQFPSYFLLLTCIVTSYLISIKGRFRSAINQSNKDYLIKIIELHRELNQYITELIDIGSQNLSRALEICERKTYSVKDLITDYKFYKLSPYISEIKENKVIWGNASYHIHELPVGFNEIPAIDKLCTILTESKLNGTYYDLYSIGKVNKKAFYLIDLSHLDSQKLNEIMFTQSALENIINETNKNSPIYNDLQLGKPNENIDYYNQQIINEYNNYRKRIDNNIITGIELLINLVKYRDAINKTINFRKRTISNMINQLFNGNN